MRLREKRNRIDSTMPFNPMDRAQYKERLGLALSLDMLCIATFTVFKWFAMPPKLSPVECASKGWINVALNTLQCQM